MSHPTRKNIRNSLVTCMTQFAGGTLLKILKCFKFMLNSFEFSIVSETAGS